MPKLILRCNYLKNAPSSHLANYMNYISTNEGMEKIDNTCGLLPATVKQKELIADILSKIEVADRMHEYYDYHQRSTRENVTEFITQALENNLDIIAKKKNYIDDEFAKLAPWYAGNALNLCQCRIILHLRNTK